MITVGIANGTGVCQNCMKSIPKGEKQIVVTGWRESGRFHASCMIKLLKENKVPLIIKK